jgi:uncharacterized SAM-binding protein YcdF (DUF218 family)
VRPGLEDSSTGATDPRSGPPVTQGSEAGSKDGLRRFRFVFFRAGALLLGILVVLSGITARLFLWPMSDVAKQADAVVVLSGDHGDRLRLARRLLAQGSTSTLVFAGQLDSDEARQLCAQQDPAYEVICVNPNPDSTRHEARAIAALVRDRNWETVMVVTTTHHLTRTRLLFRRCSDRTLLFMGSEPAYSRRTSLGVVTHEMLGLAYAWSLGRGC